MATFNEVLGLIW